MRLESLIEERAQKSPDREAIAAGDRRVTFGDLEAESNRLAHALRRLGVRRGDRVAIYLGNGVETVVSLFAALKVDAAFMMISPPTKPNKLAYLLDHARARVVVLSARKHAEVSSALQGREHLAAIIVVGGGDASIVPGKAVLAFAEATSPGASPDSPLEKRGIDLDLAALLYTSGSTGEPKGVMLTHRNVVSATQSIAAYLHLVEDDVVFMVLPLSFGYGLTQLFTTFSVGARLVIESGMTFPHLTLTRMSEERATGFAVVPTTAATLLGMDLSRYGLSLRYLTCAGGALAPAQALRLQAALPNVNIIPMYGQTECLRALYLEPAELAVRPGSVGRGMPNQELFLVDEEGHEVGPNQVGELVVRGAHVMQGYWELPVETACKLRPLHPVLCEQKHIPEDERMLYTGDLFRRDEEGYLYFVSRTDRIIKSRGEKVSPQEVEAALYTLDGVSEAAVVGAPDSVRGEAIKAIVVLRPGAQLTEKEVQRHCARLLEDHMVPHTVEFRVELAKNDRGKIVL